MYNRKVEKLQLKILKEFPNNPQELELETITMIKGNMRKVGWYGEIPTVAILPAKGNHKRGHYIVSGNHRVMCAIEVGILDQYCVIINDKKYGWEQAELDIEMFNNLKGKQNPDKQKDFIQGIIDEYNIDIENVNVELGMEKEQLDLILNDGLNIETDINEKEFDENIDTDNECPKCGYKWS